MEMTKLQSQIVKIKHSLSLPHGTRRVVWKLWHSGLDKKARYDHHLQLIIIAGGGGEGDVNISR